MDLVTITIKALEEIKKISVIDEDGDYEFPNSKVDDTYYFKDIEDILSEDRTITVDAEVTDYGFYVPEELFGSEIDYGFIPNECVSYIDNNTQTTLKQLEQDKIVFDSEDIEDFRQEMDDEGHRHFVRNLEESGYTNITIDRVLKEME